MTSGFLPSVAAPEVAADVAEESFQFDRPAERGLAVRSYGEGVLTTVEAREAAIDSIRDDLLAHFNPTQAVSRWTGMDVGPQ